MNESMAVLFDTLDEAEIAVSRLRRTGLEFRVRVRDEAKKGPAPAASPMIANAYYPYQPANMMTTPVNLYNTELGGRVMLTSEILGLPVYRAGPAELHVSVASEKADIVRSILVNSGGHFVF